MTGQINYEDNKLGKYIVQIAENPNVKTIVEIGTWNGLGTTRCVLHGFQKANKTDYNFISLECSPEMHAEAIKNNANNLNKNFKIIFGKVVSENDITSWFDVNSLSSEQKDWLRQDIIWMKNVPNVIETLPKKIDFLILDGGEFSTYLEWTALKDRVKYIALDDTSSLKCKKVREEILVSTDFKILVDDPHGSRYGCLIAERI
jgi:hypothetical protein